MCVEVDVLSPSLFFLSLPPQSSPLHPSLSFALSRTVGGADIGVCEWPSFLGT
jgi:hypothetical protein